MNLPNVCGYEYEKTSRAQVWMESLGEWSWPGTRAEAAAAVEALPPSWVPAFPPRLEPATAGAALPAHARRTGRVRAHRLITGALLCAIAAVCATLALNGQLTVEHLIGIRTAATAAQDAPRQPARRRSAPPLTLQGGQRGRGRELDRDGELRLGGIARNGLVPDLPAAGLCEHRRATTRCCTC